MRQRTYMVTPSRGHRRGRGVSHQANAGFASVLAGPVHDDAAIRALLRADAPVPSSGDYPLMLGRDPFEADGHDHPLLAEVRALLGWIVFTHDSHDPPALVDHDVRAWAARHVAAHPMAPWAMRLLARLAAEG